MLTTSETAGSAGAVTGLTMFLVFGVLVVLFVVVSGALTRFQVTAPIAFVLAGVLIAGGAGVSPGANVELIKLVAEITLVLLLFHDAAQVRPRQISRDRRAMTRLLLLGLPLTVLLGYLTARWLFPDLPVMFALLLAAALAPTDAGLGAATVLNPVVPVRVRRLLNVESGLNDGLVTPVVMFAIAAIAGAEGLRVGGSVASALVELAVGIGVGVGVGVVGAGVLGWSKRVGTSSPAGRALAVLFLPLLAYGTALAVSGNGFVAAFVAGTSFAGAARWLADEDTALELTEAIAEPLGYAVWLVFGVAVVRIAWGHVGLPEVLFAVLSLTVIRMGPVALSLLGTGLRAPTVAFVGWFGPRGLASVVFGLLALESLDAGPDLDQVLATITVTVLASVVLHGLSAGPWSRRLGAWVQRVQPPAELADASEPRSRDGRLGAGVPPTGLPG